MKRKFLAVLLAMATLLAFANMGYAENIHPFTIFKPDERVKITDTTESPYSAVCNLTITWSNGSVTYGTGFLISSTRVATVAHCMYNRSNGATATSIIVAPGDTVTGHPYGRKTVTGSSNFKYPAQYADPETTNPTAYDYGVIKLSSAFSGSPATLSLDKSYSTSEFSNMNATLLGYDYLSADLYECTGKISYANSTRLFHKMDTVSGMSGSPILDSSGDVVGINAYGISGQSPPSTVEEDYNNYNRATRITSTVYNFLTSQ